MTEPTIRFPVTCPLCAEETLGEFPVALIAIGLLQGNSVKLHAPCHDLHWNASQVELQQIREYLGAAWLAAQRL